MSLRAIDFFAGCGGMSQGLKQAGVQVIGAVEYESLAAEAYRLNHPATRLWNQDIRTLTSKQILGELALRQGELDILAACPPCQGFSSIRRLNSRVVKDRRNDLMFVVLRMLRGLRPKTFILENVPGLRYYWRWPAFLKGLKSLGYKTEWRVVNAADYGVPQRRRRLLLIASRIGTLSFPSEASRIKTVRSVLGKLPRPGRSGDKLHDLKTTHAPRIRNLIRRVPKNGGSRSDLGKRSQLACHRRTRGFLDVYGRMAWDTVSPTITGGCVNPSKGRFLHPAQDRAITLREAALLQSFPRAYKFPLTRGKHPAALLIGNAVPPALARKHAAPLVKLLASL